MLANNDDKCYTFEKAFELTGHGKFNRIVLLTCGLIHLSVSIESVGIGYILPAAECDLQLNSSQKGLLNAAAFIGIMSVSFAWGYLGDTYGRRGVMLPAMIFSIFVSTASAFSVNFTMMLVLRILTGCLVSASSATVYAYMGELHTSQHRAASMAWGAVFISFSFILLPGAAWLILTGSWKLSLGYIDLVPWRLMALCGPIASTIASIALFFLPESPKFLYSKQGPDAVLPILRKIYATNFGLRPNSFPVTNILVSQEGLRSNRGGLKSALSGIATLLKLPLIGCVAISYTSMFFVFMLSSGLYMWVPDLLNSLLSGNTNGNQRVCDIIYNKTASLHHNSTLVNSVENGCVVRIASEIFPISMAMGVVFAFTYILIGVLIDKIGKRLLYGSIMAICGVACGLVWVVRGSTAASVLLVIALASGTAASILAALTVDVFPTELRAMSMCGMYMVGRAGAAIGASVLGVLLPSRCEMAFTVFGLSVTVSTLLLFLWPKPENVRRQLEKKGWTF